MTPSPDGGTRPHHHWHKMHRWNFWLRQPWSRPSMRGHLRDLHLLMRGCHPKIGGGGQVRAAPGRPPRIVRHDPAGALAPGQMPPGRARLPARVPSFPLPRFAFAGGGARPGWSSIDGGNEEFPSSATPPAPAVPPAPAAQRPQPPAQLPARPAPCSALRASQRAAPAARSAHHGQHPAVWRSRTTIIWTSRL
jgi:hypothetical protein